jgi:hypothetical protein|tara:strand:- start:252 stop:638 length:387 start_codon:yes stop_codon:yes gene_type:complete
MSDKKLKESWINQEDRGWSTESYQNYMKRRNQEEKALQKGTYEYEYSTHDEMIRDSVKATSKQIGGNHYKDCKIMPIEYIVKNNLDFLEGNVVKYITRHKLKGGQEDIEKVIHYAELILELKYGKENR